MRKMMLLIMAAGLFSIPLGSDMAAQHRRSQSTRSTSRLTKRGIRSIDFRNFVYQRPFKPTSNSGGMRVDPKTIVLRNGRNMRKGDFSVGEYGSSLDSIKYLDFDGDGNEDAFVSVGTSEEAAGAFWEADYFVFSYRNGSANPIFHEYRYKPKGVRINGRSIEIIAYLWREADAHCCPSFIETATYVWRGAGFSRISQRLKPVPKS